MDALDNEENFPDDSEDQLADPYSITNIPY